MNDDTVVPGSDPLVGKVLADRYEVVRRLGGGGMGTVYEGKHKALGKRVAIKVLHAQHATKSESIQRFINEARAAAALGHRNIIDASDVGSTPTGAMFIVLEYLEGEDLQHVLDREGRLPIGRTVAILKQVASALAAAHAKGIVHRDLKPENVFLVKQGDERDVVKVLDFGISKFTAGDTASNMTRKGAVLGTPTYMAPEQLLDSSKTDSRADIYSIGVMAYRMLGGRLPYEGETFFDLAHKVMQEAPPDLHSLRENLPTGIVAAVMKAMEKKRDQRCQTMEDFSASLQPFVGWYADADTMGPTPSSIVGRVGREGTGPGWDSGATAAAPSVTPTGSRAHTGRMTMRKCPACMEEVGVDPSCEFCGAELEDLRVGRTLEGRYRIDKGLAAGGMGRVYIGTHLALQEPVAIKFLHGQWTESTEARARFRREAVTLAKLRHPGIVTVFDYGEYEGDLYMVMELVQGRSLRDVVPEGTAIEIPRALALVELILQVLEFAHAQSVVHRDFKPDNVMLLDLGEKSDRIKLLDFGLAVGTNVPANDRITHAGAIQGTPLYMSPEQCRGRDVGPATDVYAVGVVLFELIAGAPPFRGESLADTLAQQMFLPPPRMNEKGTRPVTTPGLEALVRDALAKEPSERPTASQMRERVRQVISGDDELTRQERAADAKNAAAMLGRDERGVYRSPPAPTVQTAKPGPAGRVVLWGLAPERTSALTTQLAVQGLTALEWSGAAAFPAAHEGQPVVAALVKWGPEGQRAVAAIRARPEFAKLPVIAMDAEDTADTMAIIRAGASDVAYGKTANDAVGKQLTKLLRRAR